MSDGSAAPPPLRWRILRDPPGVAGWNMAVDHALAASRQPDEAVLRLYRWRRPTLSFGRNQSVEGRYDPFAFEALGVEVVRRPTGGREVLHDRELTYAAILPAHLPDGLRGSYRRINEALLNALRSIGVETRLAADGIAALPPDAGACFREPASGEIMAEGRKLVGSAQRRIGASLLQHGSILLGPSSVPLEALRSELRRSVAGGEPDRERQGISLGELGHAGLSLDRISAAIEAAMAGAYGGEWGRAGLRSGEREVAETLHRQYQSPGWTWRRTSPPALSDTGPKE